MDSDHSRYVSISWQAWIPSKVKCAGRILMEENMYVICCLIIINYSQLVTVPLVLQGLWMHKWIKIQVWIFSFKK